MGKLARPPADFFEGTPLPVRACIDQLFACIDTLETRAAELEAKLGKDVPVHDWGN